MQNRLSHISDLARSLDHHLISVATSHPRPYIRYVSRIKLCVVNPKADLAPVNKIKLLKYRSQKRVQEVMSAIVEGSARILERDSFEGFNTNAVAEKAGVSIGSLYPLPAKSAMLGGVIRHTAVPLLTIVVEVVAFPNVTRPCDIRATSMRHQMQRPELSRLNDIADRS